MSESLLSALPFSSPWLLAPMEGVTDPVFRNLVLRRNPPGALGGAFTEFVRVVDQAVPERVLRRHLGSERFPAPVGVQLMGSAPQAMAASARAAALAGSPLVDLNFGCPARGALKGCAGSALLRQPERVESLVRACAEALAGEVPLTAKIRAGFDHADQVEELAQAVERGGAAMLTIHARTRAEGYRNPVDWSRIARAVAAVSIPVCGNGGVEQFEDLERMRSQTGCAAVMVGQAALANPWIFTGRRVDLGEAGQFLLEYEASMRAKGATPPKAAARVKQLLRYWRAGGLVRDEQERREWLRIESPQAMRERLAYRSSSQLSSSS